MAGRTILCRSAGSESRVGRAIPVRSTVVGLLLFFALSIGTAPLAHASTYVVNSFDDDPDAVINDDVCETYLTGGICTLRAAILQANTHSNGSQPDRIEFNLFGIVGQVQTIQPLTPLPPITDPVVINGWSQRGPTYTGPPLVELDGSQAGSSSHGLRIRANNTMIQGLIVNRFGQNGIAVETGSGVVIRG